jgi:hypothetical protein
MKYLYKSSTQNRKMTGKRGHKLLRPSQASCWKYKYMQIRQRI